MLLYIGLLISTISNIGYCHFLYFYGLPSTPSRSHHIHRQFRNKLKSCLRRYKISYHEIYVWPTPHTQLTTAGTFFIPSTLCCQLIKMSLKVFRAYLKSAEDECAHSGIFEFSYAKGLTMELVEELGKNKYTYTTFDLLLEFLATSLRYKYPYLSLLFFLLLSCPTTILL